MRWTMLLALLSGSAALFAQSGNMQQGTVVRMHMGECFSSHSFMAAFSGGGRPASVEACPEYTLVTDKVVYIIVGKNAKQLVPLAENIHFRFQNNELVIRIDDAKHESRFAIKEMVLRPEWEQERERAAKIARHRLDAALALDGPQ